MRYLCFILTIALCLAASCSIKIVNVIKHNQNDASKVADKFANLAFIKSDYAAAYNLIDPELQKTVSVERLKDEVAKMHPNDRPASLQAIEYEPIPSQHAMNIYLKGTLDKTEFFYRLLMTGDQESGYKVGGFFRGKGPYPPAVLRKPL